MHIIQLPGVRLQAPDWMDSIAGVLLIRGRVIAEAVAPNHWEEVGVLAQTQPTQQRPGTFYKVAEASVTLCGQAYQDGVVHSSTQDQRRQKALGREIHASHATLEATVREAIQQEYFCHPDAEIAAAKLREQQSTDHEIEARVEERSKRWPWPAEPEAAPRGQSAALWPADQPP